MEGKVICKNNWNAVELIGSETVTSDKYHEEVTMFGHLQQVILAGARRLYLLKIFVFKSVCI